MRPRSLPRSMQFHSAVLLALIFFPFHANAQWWTPAPDPVWNPDNAAAATAAAPTQFNNGLWTPWTPQATQSPAETRYAWTPASTASPWEASTTYSEPSSTEAPSTSISSPTTDALTTSSSSPTDSSSTNSESSRTQTTSSHTMTRRPSSRPDHGHSFGDKGIAILVGVILIGIAIALLAAVFFLLQKRKKYSGTYFKSVGGSVILTDAESDADVAYTNVKGAGARGRMTSDPEPDSTSTFGGTLLAAATPMSTPGAPRIVNIEGQNRAADDDREEAAAAEGEEAAALDAVPKASGEQSPRSEADGTQIAALTPQELESPPPIPDGKSSVRLVESPTAFLPKRSSSSGFNGRSNDSSCSNLGMLPEDSGYLAPMIYSEPDHQRGPSHTPEIFEQSERHQSRPLVVMQSPTATTSSGVPTTILDDATSNHPYYRNQNFSEQYLPPTIYGLQTPSAAFLNRDRWISPLPSPAPGYMAAPDRAEGSDGSPDTPGFQPSPGTPGIMPGYRIPSPRNRDISPASSGFPVTPRPQREANAAVLYPTWGELEGFDFDGAAKLSHEEGRGSGEEGDDGWRPAEAAHGRCELAT